MPIVKTSREEILEKAFRVFLEKGYYHTTISDLSKACNIEKPHFYYYFKNKQDLMISVLDFISKWAEDRLFIYAYLDNLSTEERMEGLLKELKRIHDKGYVGCIYGNTAMETANNEEEFLPVLRTYFDKWHKALKTIYLQRFTEPEAELKAHTFFTELNGALLLGKVFKNSIPLDNFIINQRKSI